MLLVVLSVEILYCFKVKKRVGGHLDIPGIFVLHGLEVLGSTFGDHHGNYAVGKDASNVDQQNLIVVQYSNCGNHKNDLDNDWRDVEEHESQN